MPCARDWRDRFRFIRPLPMPAAISAAHGSRSPPRGARSRVILTWWAHAQTPQGPATCDFGQWPRGRSRISPVRSPRSSVGDVTPPAVQGQLFFIRLTIRSPFRATACTSRSSWHRQCRAALARLFRGCPCSTRSDRWRWSVRARASCVCHWCSEQLSAGHGIRPRFRGALHIALGARSPITVLPGWARRPTVALPLSAAVGQDIVDSIPRAASIYLALAGQRQIGVVDLHEPRVPGGHRAARAGDS